MNKSIFLICALFLVTGTNATANDKTNAEQLIAQACKVQDLWAKDTSPYEMRAEIEVTVGSGQSSRGEYRMYWASTDQWREDIRFAAYERIRVGEKGGYRQTSTYDYQPAVLFYVDRLVHLAELLQVGKARLGKPKVRNERGTAQTCVDVRWFAGVDHTMCFDSGSSSLLKVQYRSSENPNPPEISTIHYSSFTHFGEKLVPFHIDATRNQKPFISVTVLKLEPIT